MTLRRADIPTDRDLTHPIVERQLDVYRDVHAERAAAHRKHGNSLAGSRERASWDDRSWLPVLMEEVGEAAQVLNERDLGNVDLPKSRERLREELIQVAAMAVAWVVAIDRDSAPPWRRCWACGERVRGPDDGLCGHARSEPETQS